MSGTATKPPIANFGAAFVDPITGTLTRVGQQQLVTLFTGMQTASSQIAALTARVTALEAYNKAHP